MEPIQEELIQDDLVSNTEIKERKYYYLATVKNYLESQLEQVNIALQEIIEEQENQQS